MRNHVGDTITVYLTQDIRGPAPTDAVISGRRIVITFDEPLGAAASLANSAFTVEATLPDSSKEALALAATVPPAISGNTLVLTLASQVPTGAEVSYTYTLPTDAMDNQIIDQFGNPTTNISTIPQQAQHLFPVLAADGITLTWPFGVTLDAAAVPPATAFTVRAVTASGHEILAPLSGDNQAVTISATTLMLKLAQPLADIDAVTVAYTPPTVAGATVLTDTDANPIPRTSSESVLNNSEVPRISIFAMRPAATPGIAPAEFFVRRSNVRDEELQVQIDITEGTAYLDSTQAMVTIPAMKMEGPLVLCSDYAGNTSGNLTAMVAPGPGYVSALASSNAATVAMKVPATGRTITAAFAEETFQVIEGGSVPIRVQLTTGAGVAQPRFVRECAVGSSAIATYTLDLRSGTALAGSDFPESGTSILSIDGLSWQPDGDRFTVFGEVLVATLEDDQYEGTEQFEARIGTDSGSALFSPVCAPAQQDGTACVAPVLLRDNEDTLRVVATTLSSTPGTGATYGVGETIAFTLSFNGVVAVETPAGTPVFEFGMGGESRLATYTSGTGSTDLVFEYTIVAGDNAPAGITWPPDGLRLNGGTIRFASTEVAAQVAAALDVAGMPVPVPEHQVNTPPLLRTAAVGSLTLRLTYNENLDTGSVPPVTAFEVTVAGATPVDPTLVAVGTTATVTLTLATPVTAGQVVTLDYTPPTGVNAMPLRAASDNEAAPGFTDLTVTNGTGNSLPVVMGAVTQSIIAGQPFSSTFSITITDPDGDTLAVTARRRDSPRQGVRLLPEWLRFDSETRTFSGTPPRRAGSTSINIEISVDDGRGGIVKKTFALDLGAPLPRITVTPFRDVVTAGLDSVRYTLHREGDLSLELRVMLTLVFPDGNDWTASI